LGAITAVPEDLTFCKKGGEETTWDDNMTPMLEIIISHIKKDLTQNLCKGMD